MADLGSLFNKPAPKGKGVPLPTNDFGGSLIQPPPQKPKKPKGKPRDMSQAAPEPMPIKQTIDTGGPPNPSLQQHGVSKSTPTINQDVQQITQAHVDKFGTNPSPGLIYDILKTPFDQQPDYKQLFDIPASKRDVKVQKYGASAADQPQDPTLTYERPDGLIVPGAPPGLPRSTDMNPLHLEYPSVMVGMLPLANANAVYSAISQIFNTPVNVEVTSLGQTLKEAKRIQDLSQGYDPGASLLAQEAVKGHNDAVKTISAAQQQLNKMMGTDLPITGYLNTDWQTAIHNWMQTRSYFQQTADFQRKQAGFKTYGSYLKAFQAKQKSVDKHGFASEFLNALPINVFGHGDSPWSIFKGIVSEPLHNPSFTVSYGAHVLTRTAGMTIDVIGGSLQQAKVDMAAANAFVEYASDHGGVLGHPKTMKEAKTKMRQALQDNPTWLRALYPNLPEKESERLKIIEQVTNIAGDLILLRKPTFTGEDLAAGDLTAAMKSPYVNRASRYAFAHVQNGELGRAAAVLEGDLAAERLVSAAAGPIKRGWMSPEHFRDKVAELYAHGRTDILAEKPGSTYTAEEAAPRVIPVQGSVLDSLRTRDLPTPGRLTLARRDAVRTAVDNFDKGARSGGAPGMMAANLVSFVRSRVAHATPEGFRASFDPKLPERVHDFMLKHFKDAELANKFESEVVKARATNNVGRLSTLQAKLQNMYWSKYNLGKGTTIEDEPFSPMLESEASSRFYFPGGGYKIAKNPFDHALNTAIRANRGMNALGGKLRRLIILSPALFWKHAIGDTLRRWVGGGFVFDGGLEGANKDIVGMINHDPELARRWSTFLDRTTNGELHYMSSPGVEPRKFATGEHFDQRRFMDAAGQRLRIMLDDKALNAYLASSQGDLSPIIDMILKNRSYRRLWAAKQEGAAVKRYGEEAMQKGQKLTPVLEQGPFNRPGLAVMNKRQMMDEAYTVQDYATDIFNQYRRIEEAAGSQGTSLRDALDVLRGNRGDAADRALGKWVSDNKVDFQVQHGLVGGKWDWDSATSAVVKRLMTFNRVNRNRFARNVAASQYDDLVKAGWDKADALHAAMSVAEKQTVYHMLDFANMLQVEQDLRWLSYFATKHRLYWKWVTSTAVRRPGISLAVQDMKKILDQKGNLQVPNPFGGSPWAVPAARLLWVNGKEYPEESPVSGALVRFAETGFQAQAFANGLAGSLGTGLQRNAVAFYMLSKLARMKLGWLPSSYNAAVSGLSQTDRRYLDREINHFNMDYFAEHGSYPNQASALHHALLSLASQTMWRSNLPLPLLGPFGSNKGDPMQALYQQFFALRDPVKRSAFLDAHPDFTNQFGVSKTPSDYIHLRTYWSKYTQALDQYHHTRDEIYQAARAQGYMSPEMEQQRRKVSKEFAKFRDGLIADDLAHTDPSRRMTIKGQEYGLWGQQVSKDYTTQVMKVLEGNFPALSQSAIKKGLPSSLIADAQKELKLLNDSQWVLKTFRDATAEGGEVNSAEARTRKAELIQFIQDFQPYAHDKLGKLEEQYITEKVDPYWKHVEAMSAKIQKAGHGERPLLYAQLRTWKDEQNVPVTINGVKFPPPIMSAWQNMPKELYHDRLAQLATGSWSNLANYEKQLLGIKTADRVSEGWEALAQWKDAEAQHGYRVTKGMTADAVAAIERQVPGFKADWDLANQPRLVVFEKTRLYESMPKSVKEFWDENIAPNAKAFIKVLNDPNVGNKIQLKREWEAAVNLVPAPGHPIGALAKAILDDKQVSDWLKPYRAANSDFLNSLVNKSIS